MFCGTNFWTSHWGAMWAARGKWSPVGPNSAHMKMRMSAHQNTVLPSQGSSEPEGPNRSPPPGGRGGACALPSLELQNSLKSGGGG